MVMTEVQECQQKQRGIFMPKNLSLLFFLFICDTILRLGYLNHSFIHVTFVANQSLTLSWSKPKYIWDSRFEFMLVCDFHKDPLLQKAMHIKLNILVNSIKFYLFNDIYIEFFI